MLKMMAMMMVIKKMAMMMVMKRAMMMVMMMAMMMMMKMAMMMLKNEPVTILHFSCSLTCGPYHSLKWYKVCFNDC